jgi:uncharacterized protein
MHNPASRFEEILDALEKLYREVDQRVHDICALNRGRINCRQGCTSCCLDGITVFEVEAQNIRKHSGDLLVNGAPHREGACAFLGEDNTCRIYEHRPYVCRTQGLPLSWVEEREDGSVVELRDICPVNDAGEPIETLPAEHCWSIGTFELKLAALQALAGGKQAVRVSLRSLFCITPQEP